MPDQTTGMEPELSGARHPRTAQDLIDANACFLLALDYLEGARWDPAVDSLRDTLDLAPGYPQAGGLLALTRELAAKWAQHNIRVNAIAPGFFPSRMTEKVLDKVSSMFASTPMGRPGRAGELKGVAVFLAARASDYITGQTIVVDGGATIV